MQYANLNVLIFATINIDDNWYERTLKNRFERNIRDKTKTHHDELIRRRKDYYRRKRNHDNEIIFMKIDSIEHRKRKILRTDKRKNLKVIKSTITVIRKITSYEIVNQRTKIIDNRLMYWSKSLIRLRLNKKNQTQIFLKSAQTTNIIELKISMNYRKF